MNRSSPLSRRSSASSTNPSALFDVPSPLREFHDQVGTSGSLDCGDGVALDTREGGYKTNGQGKDGTRYCGDKEMPSYMWWESNMDVDCDGAPDATTGICAGDGSYPGETAFADDDGKPIDAMKVQYVVIDQDDSFDATKFGVQPLSVVAVICGAGGQMTFGIWADTNALGSMGEASVTLARVCFGDSINGNNGHGEPDVLYIAFPGSKAETVPSSLGSDEEELFLMGKKLVEGAFGGEGEGGGGSGSSSAGGGTETGKGSSSADSDSGTSGAAGAEQPAETAVLSTMFSASTGTTRASHASSSIPSPSTSRAANSLLSGTPAPRTLILLALLVLLIAGLVAFCLTHQRHGLTQPAPPRPLRRQRRKPEPEGSSDESSGYSGEEPEEGETSLSSGSSSEDSEAVEKKRLYSGRGRKR